MLLKSPFWQPRNVLCYILINKKLLTFFYIILCYYTLLQLFSQIYVRQKKNILYKILQSCYVFHLFYICKIISKVS